MQAAEKTGRTPRAADAGGAATSGEAQAGCSTADESSSDDAFLQNLAEAPPIDPAGAEPDRAGTTLAQFRLGEALGRGGMGVVYAADDLRLERKVALKILPSAAVADAERRRRFLREARAAAAVVHANIAAVFEIGEADGTVFIAMERAAGRSLREVLREARGALPPAEAARIVREIARGVAEAHAAGVIHRDLKPENVMMDDRGRVKVLDFGLAKLVGRDKAAGDADTDLATGEGRVLGTPDYMSPEQARGRPVDARGDVFALGVILHEMATGRRPFRAGTTMELLIAIDRDPHPRARTVNPDVPAALERIIDRCLAKSPADRYADAGELAVDLDRFSTQPREEHRPISRAAILVAIGIGAIAVAALALARTRANPATVAPAEAATSSAAPGATASATVVSPAPSAGSAETASPAPPPGTPSVSPTSSASAPPVASATVKRGGPPPVPPPSSTRGGRPDPLADQL
jgi:serine/threonine-protein kinase